MLNLQKCDNGFLSTLVAAIFFKNRVWCLRFTSFWKFYSIIFDEEHHYQYRLFCLNSFFNKNIDDDHLIGPALLTCCVLSTTEKLKHIFSQFLPHTSALFYITPVSLSTAIWYYIAPQISFSAGLSLPAVWYRCCPSLCNWWSSNRSHGPGNSVNVTEGGRGGAKTICPKRRLPFYCIGWQPGLRWVPSSLSSRSRREHRADLACSQEPVITLSLSLSLSLLLFTCCTIVFCGHGQHQQRKTKSPELEFPPAVVVQEDCAARCDSPDINDINIILKLIVLRCWVSWCRWWQWLSLWSAGWCF